MDSSTNIFLTKGLGVLGEEQEVDDVFQPNIHLTTNKTGQHNYRGSHSSLLESGVTRAGMTGPGCFLIYEKENFDGQCHKLEGPTSLVFLEEITVRSIRFLPKDCANVSIYSDAVIVVSICFVVFVLALVLGFVFFNWQRGELRVQKVQLGEKIKGRR